MLESRSPQRPDDLAHERTEEFSRDNARKPAGKRAKDLTAEPTEQSTS